MTGRGRPSLGERQALTVRLDPAVHDALRSSAEQDLRSINAQLEALLREALKARGYLKDRKKGGAPA
jgi:hypothetical protein